MLCFVQQFPIFIFLRFPVFILDLSYLLNFRFNSSIGSTICNLRYKCNQYFVRNTFYRPSQAVYILGVGTGRPRHGCSLVSSRCADIERSAVNPVSEGPSSRGRRDVVEHHHRTTWRRLPALPRCFERHQATAHLWKIGWRRVQRWVNWGALFVALYSSSHISMCMFPCVKIKWRWWWWWWCIYFKSCNIHAFRTVGLRNRLQQETHQEMR